ncbi:MAG: riboflavin synthase, partial [Burkholderiaceae bacterium]|nr:riboflavin synthase [Burkholderiaceae bacterium]
MFTGIVQATAGIAAIHDRTGLRTFTLEFPEGFCQDLAIGASVSTDGVCLTVTEILSPTQAAFDVMQQSLNITTLGSYGQG